MSAAAAAAAVGGLGLMRSWARATPARTRAHAHATRAHASRPPAHARARARTCGCHLVPQPHHELGYLLDVDHVLGLVRAGVDDLGAARHLDRGGGGSGCAGGPAPSACCPTAVPHTHASWSHPPDPTPTPRDRTCSGCSSCIICLSDTKSHRLGGARPVSDSLMPACQTPGGGRAVLVLVPHPTRRNARPGGGGCVLGARPGR